MAKEKSYYENDLQSLSFKDSWLNNTVELAALGAILTGAGTLAVKGDLSGAVKSGKRGIGVIGKGFENYVKRRGNAPAQFGFQVAKKTFLNLKRLPRTSPEDIERLRREKVKRSFYEIDNNPEIQNRIRNEVARRLGSEIKRDRIDDVLDGTNKATTRDDADRIRHLYEIVRGEERDKPLGIGTPSLSKGSYKGKKQENADNAPLFNKKEITRSMVGNGLAGLAFAGGISGFHAIDRLSQNPDAQGNLENAMDLAGSFLTQKEDKRIEKNAGALEVYNRLKEIGRKAPEAVASGLGFTGVSLAAAKTINDSQKNQSEEADPKGTRVIIELGDTELTDEQNLATPAANRFGTLPKLATTIQSEISKESSFADRFSTFAKDFLGHKKEINELEQLVPSELAAKELKDADVQQLVKDQYGNLITPQTESYFTQNLYTQRADKIKQEIDKDIDALNARKAEARLKVGAGGLAVAGGGLAALGAQKKEQEHV